MRSYEVTAEFYDLLQATRYVQRADAVLSRWLGRPRVGALDVGAGTGLATELLAKRCDVTVHAVEPTRSMRTVLLSRLAGRPELLEPYAFMPVRSRISVYARSPTSDCA